MSRFSESNGGQKLITLSVVCFLLCIPLCGYGVKMEGGATPRENFAAGLGVGLLGLSLALMAVGILALIFGGTSASEDPATAKRRRSLSSMCFIGSVFGMLLSFGLCNSGGGPETHGSPNSMMTAGAVTLLLSVLAIISGIVLRIAAAAKGDDQ